MSVDSKLQTALTPLGVPVSPNLYQGEAIEYITTNYNTLPEVFADRAPNAARYIVQVHYMLPTGKNPNSMIGQISSALWSAGFTWPSVVNAADDDGQHYVLECEYADGGSRYG